MITVISQQLDPKGLPSVVFDTPYGQLVAVTSSNTFMGYPKRWYYNLKPVGSFIISGQYQITSTMSAYYDLTFPLNNPDVRLQISSWDSRRLTPKQQEIWDALGLEVHAHMQSLTPDTVISDLEEIVKQNAADLQKVQTKFAKGQREFLLAMDNLAAERTRRGI